MAEKPFPFDFVRLGEKRPTISRGTPIEPLPFEDVTDVPIRFQIISKINEIIVRINKMNVVSGDSDTGDTKP